MADTTLNDITLEWEELLKNHPELAWIKTDREWLTWLNEHPQVKVPKTLWGLIEAMRNASEALEKPGEEKEDETHKRKHITGGDLHQEPQEETKKGEKKEKTIEEHLALYKKETGKQVRFVAEKTHRKPDTSVEEATKRLEGIKPETNAVTTGLVDVFGKPLPAPPPPPREEKKEEQPSAAQIRQILREIQPPPGPQPEELPRLPRVTNFLNRGIGRGISGLNDLITPGRISNPFNIGGRLGGLPGRGFGGIGRGAGAAGRAGGQLAAGAARAAAPLLLNPWVLGGAIAVILIIVFIIVLTGQETSGTPQRDKNQIPGLTLQLSGPGSVGNKQDINYYILVTYRGPLDVVITDPLPPNTTLVAATGVYTIENNVVKWALKDNAGLVPTGYYELGIALLPTRDDVIVTNKIFANAIGSPGNPSATDFNTLMTGQGRNIGILGDEGSFTAQAMKNGTNNGLSDKESYIRQIYRAALAANVNPLAVLATWGTEAGFGLNNTEFGCDPPRPDGSGGGFPGFINQLLCGVNTWSHWMSHFEENKNVDGTLPLPSKIGNTCVYSDPFLFAAEKYGPVCTIYDANDYFQSNFVKFYKQFLGTSL